MQNQREKILETWIGLVKQATPSKTWTSTLFKSLKSLCTNAVRELPAAIQGVNLLTTISELEQKRRQSLVRPCMSLEALNQLCVSLRESFSDMMQNEQWHNSLSEIEKKICELLAIQRATKILNKMKVNAALSIESDKLRELNISLMKIYKSSQQQQEWINELKKITTIMFEQEYNNGYGYEHKWTSYFEYINYVLSSEYGTNANSIKINRSMTIGVYIYSTAALLLSAPPAVLVASCFTHIPSGVETTMLYLTVASIICLGILTYGIINDLLAVRQNLVYFRAGHQPGQKSIFKSNHRNNVAIAWGILATGGIALGFSAAIGLMTAATYGLSAAIVAIGHATSVSIRSIGVLPAVVATGAAIIALCYLTATLIKAHRYALKQSRLKRNGQYLMCWGSLSPYAKSQWRKEITTQEDASKALGNSDRNATGYNLLGFGKILLISLGALLGTSLIVGSIPQVHAFFTKLFSTHLGTTLLKGISTYLPAALGATLGLFVVGCIIYMAATSRLVHRNQDFNDETSNTEQSVINAQGDDVTPGIRSLSID